MACLSDKDKRRVYDQLGSEQAYEQQEQRGGGRGHHADFGDFVTPEDLFNHFFYGTDLPRGNQRRPAQRRPQPENFEQVGAGVLLRQFGPLLFMLLLSVIMNMASSVLEPPREPIYRYSFQQSYQYSEKLSTYRLNQIYFVNAYTIRDFRVDSTLKEKTDRKVEEEIIYRLEQNCNEANRKRQAFINLSKRYGVDDPNYQLNLDKADKIDMQYCDRLKADKKTIESFT